MDGSASTIRTPMRAPWCVLGILILFGIPTGRFLFSWYQPYLSDQLMSPAFDPALALLGIVVLPLAIWLRASVVRRRRWLWAGLSLAGGLLGFVNPLVGIAGSGLPALVYAATGLTSVTRPTGKRDTNTSWIVICVGGPLALLICWLAFSLSYVSDFRLGPPLFISTPPSYVVTVRADVSGLSPESRDGALLASRKTMLLRLKEASAGVVSARLGSDNTISIYLYNPRGQNDAVALASSRGALEVVDLGESSAPVGSVLDAEHRTVVSGQRLRIVSDWRYDEKLLVRDVRSQYDQSGQPEILLGFDADGARALRDFTSASVGKNMAIALDDVVLASSKVEGPITDGGLAVHGVTPEQARLVALKLKFGELVVPVTLDGVKPLAPAGR